MNVGESDMNKITNEMLTSLCIKLKNRTPEELEEEDKLVQSGLEHILKQLELQ